MNCESAQSALMEIVGTAVPPTPALQGHLAACLTCRTAQHELAEVMHSVESLPVEAAPHAASDAIRRHVLDDLERARRPAVPQELWLAVLFGMVSALLSLAVLGFRVDLRGLPAWAVAGGAVMWAGVFVIAFWILLRPRSAGGDLRGLVLNGLGALGFFLVADQLVPLTHVVRFCYASSWARDVLGVLGLQGVFFAVGTVYASVPLFLLSLATGRRHANPSLKGGLLAGGMFFFLLAPAIFIQCHAFTAGALLAWLVGALVGSTVGGLAGTWVQRRTLARV